ncbi:reverse transcriptase domain-containing protein [Tanacetum coccineum]
MPKSAWTKKDQIDNFLKEIRSNLETDIREKDKKSSKKQTKPSTKWKSVEKSKSTPAKVKGQSHIRDRRNDKWAHPIIRKLFIWCFVNPCPATPPYQSLSPLTDYQTAPPSTLNVSPPLSPITSPGISPRKLLTTPKSSPPPLTSHLPAPPQPSKHSSHLAINLDLVELIFSTPPTSPHAFFDSLKDLPPRTINPPPPRPSFKSIVCMRTCSQSRNLNHQQQQAPPAFVEPFDLEELIENTAPLVVMMDDNRTMAQLLEAPTEGYEDAIVVSEITADNFELKHDHFYDEVPERPEYVGKAYAFPIFPRGGRPDWLEKNPHRSILTWDDLVSKFINKFFPPSKTTNLRNEITRFQQRFDETFYEAWDRFNDLLRACPHHGFLELHQLDTFYNALNSNDQDSLNSAAGGNFLDKMPRECLRIIESKSKVRNSRNKPVVAKVGTSTSTSGISPEVAVLTTDVAELKDMMKTLILDKQKSQAPATVKAVEEKCVTCGGAHSYQNCPATDGNIIERQYSRICFPSRRG